MRVRMRLPLLIAAAIQLAFLGAIDSLLTSLVADNLTRTQHDSNRELVGQGLGNIAAGLIGGIPGAGATMRTVLNVEAGGRSRLSGVCLMLLFGIRRTWRSRSRYSCEGQRPLLT